MLFISYLLVERVCVLLFAIKALGTAFKKMGTIASLDMENTYVNQYRDAAMARYK